MNPLRFFSLLLILFASACSNETPKPAFVHTHSADSLFGRPQNINLIELSKNTDDEYELAFGEDQSKLIPTSKMADSLGAYAAINAGFFNMKAGGSVTYFEINDSTLNPTRAPGAQYSKSETLLNGAVIIDKHQGLILEAGKADSVYAHSDDEAYVLVTGPLLLKNGEKVEQLDKKFVKDRHPRSVICSKEDTILLVAIDGRSETAAGMNLYEVQDYLLSQNCVDAVNLDGGGSTTMWIKDSGVVNQPSDKTGERHVANVLMVMKRDR